MPDFRFDEDSHTYFLDGQKLLSVTQICRVLRRDGPRNPAAAAQAAKRGSMIHAACEMLDYAAEPEGITPDIAGYLVAYKRFLRDYRPEWWYIEKALYSAKDGFAGTLDRFGRIGKHFALCDLKSTAVFDRQNKIMLAAQLAGYERLLRQNQIGQADRLWGLQLKRDGGYRILDIGKISAEYGFTPEVVFMNCMEITRILEGQDGRNCKL